MRILIIGSGAREHALAKAFSRSPQKPDLSCLGSHLNPGIRELCRGQYRTGDITDPDLAQAVAREVDADLACIGPEAPLETGVADALWAAGVPVVGPRQAVAKIETSKSFCRELLRRICPEAVPAFYLVTSLDEAEQALDELGAHYVVKEDGLRGGKGVKVSGEHLHSREEALAFCRDVLSDAPQLVIEEKLVGEEFSLLSFADGEHCLHMPPAQDHKRAYQGDRGPNTGGMGSYTDATGSLPFLNRQDIVAAQNLNERVVRGLKEITGVPYQGILYGGFMATAKGVSIVEYNARFGDPEALNVLPLLEGDLAEICSALVEGRLEEVAASFRGEASVCKYLVPPGYPEKGERGLVVTVPAEAAGTECFLGSLALQGDHLVTEGSRTLAVTGFGNTLDEAEARAESWIASVGGGLVHRGDIGTPGLIQKRIDHMKELRGRSVRVGVLGSTRGTSLQGLFDAVESFSIPASVEVVLSDRPDAVILGRARERGIPARAISPRTPEGEKKDRTLFDEELTREFRFFGVDVILCVGYMRILSREFCSTWHGKALNIHPSLLPDFAGAMDGAVHEAVLAAGRQETGCTVHLVTAEVDAGPIILQKRCPVLPGDTPETLKDRVQALESQALVEAVCRAQDQFERGMTV
ncbi:phosphoribosylamine--glycine ligase [Alkalispirochaeta americana]|uniref:Multifunctional fusion protein n=1 Tax=Alkalispirochaeta americana TaxID=159291 RepID=A0A1N6VCR9_9SPIO|nr:phosphoribosylamine--glycine ligase [Alkalispirochaeta americana]SIQ75654.1 phosphoribosylamine--glycine ligase [Alkalispirochaeta americana]